MQASKNLESNVSEFPLNPRISWKAGGNAAAARRPDEGDRTDDPYIEESEASPSREALPPPPPDSQPVFPMLWDEDSLALEQVVLLEPPSLEAVREDEVMVDVAESQTMQDVAESQAMQDVAESQAKRDVAESEAMRDVAESEAKLDVAESEAKWDVAESEAKRDVAERPSRLCEDGVSPPKKLKAFQDTRSPNMERRSSLEALLKLVQAKLDAQRVILNCI